MASTRTARVTAVALALPFAAALCTGAARADNGGLANNGSSSAATSQTGTGVSGSNHGNSTTGQQVANGPGASNQNNTASVNGSGVTVVDQDNANVDFKQNW